jgi:hypothetical protein
MRKRLLAAMVLGVAFTSWSQSDVASQSANCYCSLSLDAYYGDGSYAGYFANSWQTFIFPTSTFACALACADWGNAWVAQVCDGPIESWANRIGTITYPPNSYYHSAGPDSGGC